MKKWCVILSVIFSSVVGSIQANAQSYEAQQLLLDWQKLSQLKNILSDLYKGYEIISQGYETIKNISQGNFSLHQLFLNGLLQVSPAIQKYKRIADIISGQLQIVKEYKTAWNHFKEDKNFSVDELDYLQRVYSNLVNESLKNLDDLITVVTAGTLRMSDDERLKVIDKIFEQVTDQLSFLRSFNNSTALLSLQRAKEQDDVDVSRKLHNVTN
jgi:DNA repair ATPase RecN